MSARMILIGAGLALLAGCATPAAELSSHPLDAHEDAAASMAALAAACAGRDGWADPAPPARIHGNTFHVGTCGIAVLLLAGAQGHILIDSGPAEAAPLVLTLPDGATREVPAGTPSPARGCWPVRAHAGRSKPARLRQTIRKRA